MKTILTIICILVSAQSFAGCDEIYFKFGTGYKFEQSQVIEYQGKEYSRAPESDFSARIETGVECGNLTFGIGHRSQWETGAPFNDKKEPHVTEFFVDYKFSWGL